MPAPAELDHTNCRADAVWSEMAKHVRRMTVETLAQVPPGHRLVSSQMELRGDDYVLVTEWEPE